MKKRIIMVAMTALVLGFTFTACGEEEKNGPATMEDVAELLETPDTTREPAGPAFEGIDELIANMPTKVAEEIQTNGIMPEESLLGTVRMAVSCSVDPCSNAQVTEQLSYAANYLVALGQEKAPEHPLTKFGQELNKYIDLVAVKGGSAYDVDVENQLAVIDQLVADSFGDDSVIAAKVTEFYRSVQ